MSVKATHQIDLEGSIVKSVVRDNRIHIKDFSNYSGFNSRQLSKIIEELTEMREHLDAQIIANQLSEDDNHADEDVAEAISDEDWGSLG